MDDSLIVICRSLSTNNEIKGSLDTASMKPAVESAVVSALTKGREFAAPADKKPKDSKLF